MVRSENIKLNVMTLWTQIIALFLFHEALSSSVQVEEGEKTLLTCRLRKLKIKHCRFRSILIPYELSYRSFHSFVKVTFWTGC